MGSANVCDYVWSYSPFPGPGGASSKPLLPYVGIEPGSGASKILGRQESPRRMLSFPRNPDDKRHEGKRKGIVVLALCIFSNKPLVQMSVFVRTTAPTSIGSEWFVRHKPKAVRTITLQVCRPLKGCTLLAGRRGCRSASPDKAALL